MATMNIVALASILLLSLSPPPSHHHHHTSKTPSMTGGLGSVDALSRSIVIIGLNPAYQKRFVLPPDTNLEPGNVHRCVRCDAGVGGKGQDVGVALSCLSKKSSRTRKDDDDADDDASRVILAQFLGIGAEGDAVSSALKYEYGLTDESLTIRNEAPLRTCTTIVGADCATELVETSGIVTEDEMMALMDNIDELTRRGIGGEGYDDGRGVGKADCVCVMGSMPPGCPEDTYSSMLSRLADRGSLVLIDSVIGLDPLLRTLKSIYDDDDDDDDDDDNDSSTYRKGGGGAVLKLNAAELCKLACVSRMGAGEGCRVTHEELSNASRGFVDKYTNAIGGLEYLCVTDGKFPGYVVELPKTASSVVMGGGFRMWQLPPVDLSNRGTLYPIGAGDTVSGATLAAMQYLRRGGDGVIGGGGGGGRVVVSPEVGKLISEKKAMWSDGGMSSEDDDAGCGMAVAFAFGLACGSASCLREDNSVFDVEDAMSFFGGMSKPVVRSIAVMDSVGK